MKKNEIRKELLLSKQNAYFSHYCSGNLYYIIELIEGTYQFPIATIEDVTVKDKPDVKLPFIKLSSDLGTTDFCNEIKASLLWRWIEKAIDSGDFIKI